MNAFEKLTHLVEGEPRIISDPPLMVPIDELLPTQVERDELEEQDGPSFVLTGGRLSRPPPPA